MISMLCTKSENWVHGTCVNVRVTAKLTASFVGSRFRGMIKGVMKCCCCHQCSLQTQKKCEFVKLCPADSQLKFNSA